MNYETLSTDELIQALKQAGRFPDIDLIRICFDRVDELELELLDLLRVDPWQKYNLEDDTNPLAYGEIHAGHLLIAARSQAALPVFDEIFRDSTREHLIEWFSMAMHHYGSVALPPFSLIVLDEDAFVYGRSSATAILTKIVYNEPEYRPIVISTMQKLLPPLPEGDKPIIGEDEHDEMWMWAALELSKLGDRESLAQIEALYAEGAIDSWVIGGYDDHLERLQNEHSDASDSYDIVEVYESLHQQNALYAQRVTEAGRLEEELAIKKEQLQILQERVARKNQGHERLVVGTPVTPRTEPKVGRNAPCPCGSGKKYKKCHGRPGQ